MNIHRPNSLSAILTWTLPTQSNREESNRDVGQGVTGAEGNRGERNSGQEVTRRQRNWGDGNSDVWGRQKVTQGQGNWGEGNSDVWGRQKVTQGQENWGEGNSDVWGSQQVTQGQGNRGERNSDVWGRQEVTEGQGSRSDGNKDLGNKQGEARKKRMRVKKSSKPTGIWAGGIQHWDDEQANTVTGNVKEEIKDKDREKNGKKTAGYREGIQDGKTKGKQCENLLNYLVNDNVVGESEQSSRSCDKSSCFEDQWDKSLFYSELLLSKIVNSPQEREKEDRNEMISNIEGGSEEVVDDRILVYERETGNKEQENNVVQNVVGYKEQVDEAMSTRTKVIKEESQVMVSREEVIRDEENKMEEKIVGSNKEEGDGFEGPAELGNEEEGVEIVCNREESNAVLSKEDITKAVCNIEEEIIGGLNKEESKEVVGNYKEWITNEGNQEKGGGVSNREEEVNKEEGGDVIDKREWENEEEKAAVLLDSGENRMKYRENEMDEKKVVTNREEENGLVCKTEDIERDQVVDKREVDIQKTQNKEEENQTVNSLISLSFHVIIFLTCGLILFFRFLLCTIHYFGQIFFNETVGKRDKGSADEGEKETIDRDGTEVVGEVEERSSEEVNEEVDNMAQRNRGEEQGEELMTTVFLTELPDKENSWMFQCEPSQTSLEVPFKLTPGQTYEARVTFSRQQIFQDLIGYCTIGSHSQTFRAEYTKEEFQELYSRAVVLATVAGHSLKPCANLYRNKSPPYFNHIFNWQKGVMTRYFKTGNGSPENYINGIMKGLFFLAAHQPSQQSPFGPVRLIIPATSMITEQTNLYFADFYCNKRTHKVTIILTEIGSNEDLYCKEKMILLDKSDNPFLVLKSQSTWQYLGPRVGFGMFPQRAVYVSVAEGVIIEVFYTASINLHQAASCGANYARVEALNYCTPQRMRKNKQCTYCNINSQEG